MDNFRDTFVGQLLRLITRNKILQYPDEIHPEAYRQAISTDRTLTQAQSLQSWTTTRNTNILEIGDRSAIREEYRPSGLAGGRNHSGIVHNDRYTVAIDSGGCARHLGNDTGHKNSTARRIRQR